MFKGRLRSTAFFTLIAGAIAIILLNWLVAGVTLGDLEQEIQSRGGAIVASTARMEFTFPDSHRIIRARAYMVVLVEPKVVKSITGLQMPYYIIIPDESRILSQVTLAQITKNKLALSS